MNHNHKVRTLVWALIIGMLSSNLSAKTKKTIKNNFLVMPVTISWMTNTGYGGSQQIDARGKTSIKFDGFLKEFTVFIDHGKRKITYKDQSTIGISETGSASEWQFEEHETGIWEGNINKYKTFTIVDSWGKPKINFSNK